MLTRQSQKPQAEECMAAENAAQRLAEKACRNSKGRSLPGGLAERVLIALLSGTLLKVQRCCETLGRLPAHLAVS